MSYAYTGYHLRQVDYLTPRTATEWNQPANSTWNLPPSVLHHHHRTQSDQAHPQHHPYQVRQPTCWDPPWLRQTTAYQQPSSYEPDMYSPLPPSCWDPSWVRTHQGYSTYDQPPPRPPSCWDPPAHRSVCQPTSWDLPSQHQSIEFQQYDQPLPPDPNSSWNQPAPRQPRLATTAANPIGAMLERLLEACNRMEARLDATDRRIDNLNIDAVYGSLKSMNEFIPDEVAANCPLNFDMVMLEDDKGNDGGDQPIESGEDTPNVSVEEKSKFATMRQNGKLYADEDALLEYGEDDGFLKTSSLSTMPQYEALECIQIRLDLSQQINNDDGVTASVDCISKWSRSTSGEGRYIRGLRFNQSQLVAYVPIMIRFGVGEYNWTARSFTFDPGGDILTKLRFASLFVVWIPP